jgi:hypothetical protein
LTPAPDGRFSLPELELPLVYLVGVILGALVMLALLP